MGEFSRGLVLCDWKGVHGEWEKSNLSAPTFRGKREKKKELCSRLKKTQEGEIVHTEGMACEANLYH